MADSRLDHLIQKWRTEIHHETPPLNPTQAGAWSTKKQCADELEAALRAEGSSPTQKRLRSLWRTGELYWVVPPNEFNKQHLPMLWCAYDNGSTECLGAVKVGKGAEGEAVPPVSAPGPELLKRAIDDRDARPWRYYRFEREQLKQFCEELADKLEARALPGGETPHE